MPRVTLEYQLPEEEAEFNDACLGGQYRMLLGDIYEMLKKQWKYNAGDVDPDEALNVWREICKLNDGKLEIP